MLLTLLATRGAAMQKEPELTYISPSGGMWLSPEMWFPRGQTLSHGLPRRLNKPEMRSAPLVPWLSGPRSWCGGCSVGGCWEGPLSM